MERHFTFGHTIAPSAVNEQSSEDLLELFKIGDQKINLQQKQERSPSNDDQDSDETVKNKKIKKQKKEKKEKKEKKQHKQKEKKDKNKKQKKEKKDKKKKDRSRSQDSDGNLPLALIEKTKKIELYEKYAKVLDHTSLDEKLTHKFQLNLKLGEGTLNVDIIRFPEPRLFQYGPMDKEIPRYQRLANFQKIIGFEKIDHRKGKQLIRDLNKIISQKNIVYNEDQISKDRYFDYKGYENVGFEKLAREKKLLTSEFLLKFNLTEAPASTEEENVLKITKEFNKRINQNPKDINLWLEFIGIQDTFSLSIGSLKNKAAVIDRKISIIEKALTLNQFNEKLGLLYLGFLFEKQHDHKEISKKCMEFIMKNPTSISLWRFYFSLSIEQFSSFSHPYIRKVFEEMNNLFKKLIEKTKSAIQIWKIRKASLEVLKNMLHIYKLQGYGQLSTGIIVALLQYNIFMPEQAINMNQIDQKLKHFERYWQDYTSCKLGESKLNCNWSNIVTSSSVQHQKFIGSFMSTTQPKHRNPIMKEIMQSQQRWRMSNAVKDQQLIQQLPQSFILYEDIDFALMLYRDNDSLITLIDIMADHLQLPQVFSTSNIYKQFNFKVVETVIKNIFNHKSSKVEGTSFQKYPYFWTKYWNPSFTDYMFPEHNIAKIEYFRRILISVKQKLPIHKSKINQYLSFLICAIYLSPKMQTKLCVTEQGAMEYLSEIIKDEPLNIGTWCIYIETTYKKKQNKQECVQCFLQLFGTVKFLITDVQQQKRLNLEVLFWLTEFTRVHQLDIGVFLLKMYKKMAFDEVFNIQLIETLNGFDCLQLQQYFIDEIGSLLEKKSQNILKQTHIQRYRSVLFLLLYLQEFPFSSLTVLKDKIGTFFIQQLAFNPPNSQFFILKMLTSYKLLTFDDIITYELLKNYPYLIVIQYWISSFRKPLMLLQGEFINVRGKNLTLWMVCSIFIWKSQINHDHFYDFFYTSCKKLCFQDCLNDQHPQYIALLNELLIYDVNDNHSKFIMYSLHHIPFSKKLYLLNLLLSETSSEKQKLVTLIHQKSIRILDHSILS